MRKKFNVKDKRFPKWNHIKPNFKFVNDLENIDVELQYAPSINEILKMAVGPLLSTWDACGRHLDYENDKADLDEVDEETAMKLFFRACNHGFLPAFLENVSLNFLFDGINWHDVTHLIRSRKMTFFADCSGDKLLNEREITIPEAIIEAGKEEEYTKIMKDSMQLYCDLMNDKNVSHHDARLVIPRTMGTFYYVRMNLGDAMRVCHQRFDAQTQPKSDTIMMVQMWLEICRKYPFLSVVLDLDEKNRFYINECKTHFASMFYQPLEQNKEVLNYTKPEDFLYEKSPDQMYGRKTYNKLMDGYRKELKELQDLAHNKYPYLFTDEYKEDYRV